MTFADGLILTFMLTSLVIARRFSTWDAADDCSARPQTGRWLVKNHIGLIITECLTNAEAWSFADRHDEAREQRREDAQRNFGRNYGK